VVKVFEKEAENSKPARFRKKQGRSACPDTRRSNHLRAFDKMITGRGLTPGDFGAYLTCVRLMKLIFLAAFVVVLAAYSFDCGAAMTPEQAMKCCDSMPCSSQGQHGQDCCNTMPSAQASFVQPTSVAHASFVPIVFALLRTLVEAHDRDSSVRVIAAFAHDPPVCLLSASVPLRI
jgi:hypothetical protein